MEGYFDKYLKEHIVLNDLKIVEGTNKKIITSSIFIPEVPQIRLKTFNYYTGLIKSIETIHRVLEPDWIYCPYCNDYTYFLLP